MRITSRPGLSTLGVAAAMAAMVAAGSGADAQSVAQAAPAAAAVGAAGDAAQIRQIALTPALVDQFMAAKKDIDAVLDKLPDGVDQPDPATLGKLDTVAKTHKFDDYNQYDATETNIGIVMAGIDPSTKQYIGPEAVIKKQIAEVQADKQIAAKDKTDTVDQLKAAIATLPKLQFAGNVDVVVKNFDRLVETMPQD